MLPETLSANVCSLKANVDRAAIACHLVIDKSGTLKSWRFTRAVIRCVANLAYEDAQSAIDGTLDHPLTGPVLKPLWGAWAALAKARDKREPLELDLPERSEEHTSELQSLMRISYAVFCLKKKK